MPLNLYRQADLLRRVHYRQLIKIECKSSGKHGKIYYVCSLFYHGNADYSRRKSTCLLTICSSSKLWEACCSVQYKNEMKFVLLKWVSPTDAQAIPISLDISFYALGRLNNRFLREKGMVSTNVSYVMKFLTWWVLISKVFAQKSTVFKWNCCIL